MWTTLLIELLSRAIRHGRLTVHFANGKRVEFGDGTGEPVTLHLSDDTLARRLEINPELAVGEAYTDGTLTIEDDDLRGFLSLAIRNIGGSGNLWWQRPADGARERGAPLRSLGRALRPLP